MSLPDYLQHFQRLHDYGAVLDKIAREARTIDAAQDDYTAWGETMQRAIPDDERNSLEIHWNHYH